MSRLTERCSIIFISIGEKTRVYHSVEDIPLRLRERLIESTQGANAATILIADKDGREQLLRAVQQREAARSPRLGRAFATAAWRLKLPRLTWDGAGRILVLGGLGYILYVLISLR